MVVNLFGLGVSIAVIALTSLYVLHENQVNKDVVDFERVFRINASITLPGRAATHFPNSPGSLGPAIYEASNQVEAFVRFIPSPASAIVENKAFTSELLYTDPGFSEVFNPVVLEGNVATALTDVSSVVLSSRLAQTLLGNQQSYVGKSIDVADFFGRRTFTIRAVIEAPAERNSRQYDLLTSFDEGTLNKVDRILNNWAFLSADTFLKLKPDADIAAIEANLVSILVEKAPDIQLGGRSVPISEIEDLSLLNLGDLYLYAGPYAQPGSGSFSTVLSFAVVAALTLVLSSTNYINLALSQVSRRMREAAVRKVSGASKTNLITQFVFESLLLVVSSGLIGAFLVELTLPFVKESLGYQLDTSFVFVWILFGSLILGLLISLFPSFQFASIKPSEVLHGKNESPRVIRFRSFLVFSQFVISISLIICTIIIGRQTDFIQNKDLGFDKDATIVVDGIAKPHILSQIDAFKRSLKQKSFVANAAISTTVPGGDADINAPIRRDGAPEATLLGRNAIDFEYLDTLGLQIVAGRKLNLEISSDDARLSNQSNRRPFNILVNQSGARALGFESAQQALGQTLYYALGGSEEIEVTIVGIVRDFHAKSLHQTIRPAFFFVHESTITSLSIKLQGTSVANAISEIEALWQDFYPDEPFNAISLADKVAAGYDTEEREASLFKVFSMIAIIIAAFGLYGLTAFAAARRTREIGVRKIMGATPFQITRLLIWQFSRPVILANLVAWPIAYYAMNNWLESFAYRINLAVPPFLVATIAVCVVAIATVCYHAIRVSQTNPIIALKHE